MVRKKISELPTKPDLAPTDLLVVVDTELVRKQTKNTTIAELAAAIDAVPNAQRGQPGGVATLDATTGKLTESQLPLRATTEVYSVISEAALLALVAQTGDVAVRTDVQKTFVLAGANPANLSHWQEIITPAPPLNTLPDVLVPTTAKKTVLVLDPALGLWSGVEIDNIVDGGMF